MAYRLVVTVLTVLFSTQCAASEPGEGRLEPCKVSGVEGDTQCGTYTVFEDRKKKAGRTIDIGFVILRALEPSQNLDPLVVVAGGPGQAVTPLASVFNRRYGNIRRHRDLVFIDQRGTGQSNSLACNSSLPGGTQSLFGNLFPADHISECRDKLTQRADPRLYTTPIAADDMDEIRQWLGYEKLNLVGGSYGTVLLLSGEWDPVTPPSWGAEVAEHLPNSLHLVMPRTGHGVAAPCASGIQDQFVSKGATNGLDLSCLQTGY